jgi:predicted lipid-binding transport protein (Tim44 family)
MLALSFIWLLLGVFIGALALGARLRPLPAYLGRYGWAAMLGIGALAGLIGGWLGTILYGRFFGTACAAWIAVLSVTLVFFSPWALNRMQRWRASAK